MTQHTIDAYPNKYVPDKCMLQLNTGCNSLTDVLLSDQYSLNTRNIALTHTLKSVVIKMEEIATLSVGMALIYHMVRSYFTLHALQA